MIKKNERGAGRKPLAYKGKSVTFYLNPMQEKSVKAYVANLRVDNDLLAKLEVAIYESLSRMTLECLDVEPKYRRSSDEMQGYDLEDYHAQDVRDEWESQKSILVDCVRDIDGKDSSLAKVLEKIIEGVDYD